MADKARVLATGLDPEGADFSQMLIPGLTKAIAS